MKSSHSPLSDCVAEVSPKNARSNLPVLLPKEIPKVVSAQVPSQTVGTPPCDPSAAASGAFMLEPLEHPNTTRHVATTKQCISRMYTRNRVQSPPTNNWADMLGA